MKIIKNFPLKNYNTFKIDVLAKYFVEVNYFSELEELISSGVFENNPFFILGGGSNVLFTRDFDGIVIKMNLRGIQIIESNDEFSIIEVSAGEKWSDFVSICVRNNLAGLENLAGIPGTVGSAPIQNIGAYNSEQKDAFEYLIGFDLLQHKFRKLFAFECNFDYRNSIFKNELKDKFVVTKVAYRLNKKFTPNLGYKELKNEIEKFNIKSPDLRYVYETVLRLRKRKLPDTEVLPNAGSFFKNPIITSTQLDELLKTYSDLPYFKVDANDYKIPAGWLIEKCDWKGIRVGDAGVSLQHALILVNYGQASGNDILGLAEKIRQSVLKKFNIFLEFEVIIL